MNQRFIASSALASVLALGLLSGVNAADEKTGGKAFHAWHEFDHPQLGKVEIGGWDTKN